MFYHDLQYQRSFYRYLEVAHPEIPKEEFLWAIKRSNYLLSGSFEEYRREFNKKTKEELDAALSGETLKVSCDPTDFNQFFKNRCVEAYEQGIYDFLHHHEKIVKILLRKNNWVKRDFYEFELYRQDPKEWVKHLESDDHAVVSLQRPIDVADIIFKRRFTFSFAPESCMCAANSLVVLKHAKNPQLKEYALQILIDSLNVMENIERLNHIEKLEQSQKARQKGKRANVFKVDALQNLQKQCGGPGVKSVSERKRCYHEWAVANNIDNLDYKILIPVFIWDWLSELFEYIKILELEKENSKFVIIEDVINEDGEYESFEYERPIVYKFESFILKNFKHDEKLLLQGGQRHRQFESESDFMQRLPELVETYKEIKKRGLW